VSAVRAAIASGDTTERRAYEAYAAVSARPYARSSWEVMLRSRKPVAKPERGPGLWSRLSIPSSKHRAAPVKPSNVLTLTGDSASLSVKRGALIAAQDAARSSMSLAPSSQARSS
jgi:hypothetical protein